MRRVVRPLLFCCLIGVSGCTGTRPWGQAIDDSTRQAALLQGHHDPDAQEVVFRTLIRWKTREISMVEVVKRPPEGGFSVAGVTDVGGTLYAARIDPLGKARVIRKSLPVSDRWLMDNVVTELLLPWRGPEQADRLHRLPDGTWALVRKEAGTTWAFLFDQAGYWREARRFWGGQLCSQTSLEWDQGSVPSMMRVHNRARHYHAIRERVANSPP